MSIKEQLIAIGNDAEKRIAELESQLIVANATIANLQSAAAPVTPPLIADSPSPVVTDEWVYPAVVYRGDCYNLNIDARHIERMSAKSPYRVMWAASSKKEITYQRIQCRNVVGSFFEQDMIAGDLIFDQIEIGKTGRYGIYIGARDASGNAIVTRSAVNVQLSTVIFGASEWETPLRVNEGVAIEMKHVQAIEGNERKNWACARLHGHEIYAESCRFGWTKIGPQEDGKNDPASRTREAYFNSCEFLDGFRITRGVENVEMCNCTISIRRNPANKDLSGHVQDVTTIILFDRCDFVGDGKIEFPNSKVTYTRCTRNGTPFSG